jgi:hypothetical protein
MTLKELRGRKDPVTLATVEVEQEVELEENIGEEETVPYKYAITSYGADYPVDGLVKRIQEESIYVPPFQRGFVWNMKQSSRFVESLLLGLPVPAIFLAREKDTQKLLVIDGQQRLRTLQFFYDGKFPTGTDRFITFALSDVPSDFKGATYKALPDEDRRRLDDSILHAIIVKQDEPSEDDSSIYHVFERLNTGGTLLQPQEIRHSIYHGPFDELLRELNFTEAWRAVYGPLSPRMKDEELILRFSALYFDFERYKQPMKGFLNKYMGRNRKLTVQSADDLRNAFEPTIQLVYEAIGPKAFRPRRPFNVAVFDAVMVGLARRLSSGKVGNKKAIEVAYEKLVNNAQFISATETGTSQEDNVTTRISLATAAFAHLR